MLTKRSKISRKSRKVARKSRKVARKSRRSLKKSRKVVRKSRKVARKSRKVERKSRKVVKTSLGSRHAGGGGWEENLRQALNDARKCSWDGRENATCTHWKKGEDKGIKNLTECEMSGNDPACNIPFNERFDTSKETEVLLSLPTKSKDWSLHCITLKKLKENLEEFETNPCIKVLPEDKKRIEAIIQKAESSAKKRKKREEPGLFTNVVKCLITRANPVGQLRETDFVKKYI